MSAIVIREVRARKDQYAYEVEYYRSGAVRADKTRRTGNHATKDEAYNEAKQIQEQLIKESEH